MVTGIIDAAGPAVQRFSSTRAADLTPAERGALAIKVLTRTAPVSELARRHQVSRPFLYRQAHAASEALQARFDPSPADPAAAKEFA